MSSRRLSTLWAREMRGSQTSYISQCARGIPSTTPLVSASCPSMRSTRSSLRSSFAIRSYSQGKVADLAKNFSRRPGTAAETYVAYGMTQKLFEACSSQADYKIPQASQKGAEVPKTAAGEDLGVGEGWWYKELGLKPTFSTWSQVTFLHMYLLTVRLRALPYRESVTTYSRHLIDHFSHEAEHRMDVYHDLGSRTIRNKYLKDLFIQWRGIIAAYDEGLAKGDAVLGAAVWRNLWKGSQTGPDGEEIDWAKVAQVVVYIRRVLSELAKKDEVDLVFAIGSADKKTRGIFGYSEADKKLVESSK
ncbi:hypothetical protein N7499_011413 [Penicillium canescens]|uniref:Ubiquinol-cytochrome c chaperone domain-containing protein n=1 Tax=Penicillium canescens TaxID=5083 RepID=A0AAD6IKP3_PENCN|nr:uncharacterized protein N7446_006667 [Penicillium canescens]KAJ5990865.1 hypothetical protein N7522_011072 [Penicillium canescens]KAJ6050005.1 hypothetical protein N7444_006721 [Penicillium canescens]KAJ6052028.1 hypothetical protein N7460_002562 [Penicillium canescens]KAJ6062547.1 hypothetical protein N7446_006667 [Penicillium canescens]KAJ6069526.1 hypothetical protein N7499_011413 [Penicillium canescens]